MEPDETYPGRRKVLEAAQQRANAADPDGIGQTAEQIVETMERVQEYARTGRAPVGLPLMGANDLFNTILRLARIVRDLEQFVARDALRRSR